MGGNGAPALPAGFDFVVQSDHFHPWLSDHSDSPFAWATLGAVATSTRRVRIGTLVTCPIGRYHPALVAQAAATVQELAEGRFFLSVGAGEQLNEHVTGQPWPPVDVRHEMLEEAIGIIRQLWEGGWVTHRGPHFTVADARLFTLPSTPPEVLVAASGSASQELAARHGDGLVGIEPDPALVEGYRAQASGDGGRTLGQVAFAYDPEDPDRAEEQAMRFRFGALGWPAMAELPNVTSFDSATAHVTPDQVVGELVVTGTDPQVYADAVAEFLAAGYEDLLR